MVLVGKVKSSGKRISGFSRNTYADFNAAVPSGRELYAIVSRLGQPDTVTHVTSGAVFNELQRDFNNGNVSKLAFYHAPKLDEEFHG